MRKKPRLTIAEAPSELLRSNPETWRWGRSMGLQLAKVERNLFTTLEENESQNAIIYDNLKLRRAVKEVDFQALIFAVTKILSDQSAQHNNTDTNSGTERQLDEELKRQTGRDFFGGTIVATLNQICEEGYGEKPDNDQRRKLSALIQFLKENSLEMSIPITNNFGELDKIRVKDTLMFPIREGIRESDGAKYYILYLHPIFCDMSNGWATIPRNATAQLAQVLKKKKKNRRPEHYHLMRLLYMQQSSEVTRSMESLLEELGLSEEYEDKPGRTEEKLIETFKDLKEAGVISEYTPTFGRVGRRRNAIVKVSFKVIRPKNRQKKLSGMSAQPIGLPPKTTGSGTKTDNPKEPSS